MMFRVFLEGLAVSVVTQNDSVVERPVIKQRFITNDVRPQVDDKKKEGCQLRSKMTNWWSKPKRQKEIVEEKKND
jgi:hypothetical protein